MKKEAALLTALSPLFSARSSFLTALFLIFPAVLPLPAARAETYYVSPGGSDSWPGTSAQPWRTIQHAADELAAGDTAVVRDGAYAGFETVRSGAPGSPIVFRAEGASALINSGSGQDFIRDYMDHHVVIEGFRVTNAPRAGIAVLGEPGDPVRYVTVRDCVCYDNGKWGIFTGYAEDFVCEGNETSGSTDEHGIYVSNSADRPVIRFNVSHDNRACGIQINADPALPGDGIISGAVVEKNVIYGNGAGGGAGVNLASVRDSLIANNLITGNHAGGIAGWDDGNGTQWGCKNNRFYANTVHMPSDGRWALSLKNGSTGNDVKNNVLIHEGPRGGIELDTSSLTGLMSDYNIQKQVCVDDTFLPLATWQADYAQDLHSADRGAAETFLQPGADHRLLGSAWAVDHGTSVAQITDDLDGVLRPQGAAFDIGCYERQTDADLNGDGSVDAADLGIMMSGWGPNPSSPADLDGSGAVDADDLTILIAAWTYS